MSGSRRRALQVAVALAVGVAGCIGGFGGAAPGSGSTPDATADHSFRQVTPTGDPASVTYTVDRDTVEYLEANGSIRYVAAWRTHPGEIENGSEPERTPVYETVSFEEWARTECPYAGSVRLNDVLASRLGGPVDGVSAGITTENDTVVVTVIHRTLYDRSGDRISTPSVGFDRLVDATPRRMTVTLTIENRTTTCGVAVVAASTGIRQT